MKTNVFLGTLSLITVCIVASIWFDGRNDAISIVLKVIMSVLSILLILSNINYGQIV